MAISPKTKKILAISGGAVLTVVCMIAMTKCKGNADGRELTVCSRWLTDVMNFLEAVCVLRTHVAIQ